MKHLFLLALAMTSIMVSANKSHAGNEVVVDKYYTCEDRVENYGGGQTHSTTYQQLLLHVIYTSGRVQVIEASRHEVYTNDCAKISTARNATFVK